MRFSVACLSLEENKDAALHAQVSGRHWPRALGFVPQGQLGHRRCVSRASDVTGRLLRPEESLGPTGAPTEPMWDQGTK